MMASILVHGTDGMVFENLHDSRDNWEIYQKKNFLQMCYFWAMTLKIAIWGLGKMKKEHSGTGSTWYVKKNMWLQVKPFTMKR